MPYDFEFGGNKALFWSNRVRNGHMETKNGSNPTITGIGFIELPIV